MSTVPLDQCQNSCKKYNEKMTARLSRDGDDDDEGRGRGEHKRREVDLASLRSAASVKVSHVESPA